MDVSRSKPIKYPQSSCIPLFPSHSPGHVSDSKERHQNHNIGGFLQRWHQKGSSALRWHLWIAA